MALDRGVRINSPVVVQDRSKEYVDAINKNIASLKKEEALIKEAISLLKEKHEAINAQFDVDIAVKQQKVSDLSVEIGQANKRLDAVNLKVSEATNAYIEENNRMDARRKDVDNSIREKLEIFSNKEALLRSSIELLEKDIGVKSSEVARLDAEIEALRALNKSLANLNLELDGKKRENEIAIEEAKKVVPAIESELSQKKEEVRKLSDSAKLLAEDRNRIKNELAALQREKDQIAIDRDKNTKRARELADMANELKVESIALANKNAYLSRREATLKDAQTKVGG